LEPPAAADATGGVSNVLESPTSLEVVADAQSGSWKRGSGDAPPAAADATGGVSDAPESLEVVADARVNPGEASTCGRAAAVAGRGARRRRPGPGKIGAQSTSV